MNTRIKKLRKALNLTAEKFGTRIGVTRSTISNLESGHRNVTEQTIKLVVNEFNVNEDWLRFGKGEMFNQSKKDFFDDLRKQYNLDEFGVKAIKTYLELNAEDRKLFKDYVYTFVNKFANKIEETETDDIDAKVESYRRELELEKKGREKSSVLQDIG